MAFIKDPDAHTRGVNAVAAYDGSGRGRALQRLKMRAMQRRDRALSAVARGAMSGLGAIDRGKIGGTTVWNTTVVHGGGGSDLPAGGVGGSRPIPGGTGGATSPQRNAYVTAARQGRVILDPMTTTAPPLPGGVRTGPAVPTKLTPGGTRPVPPLPTPGSSSTPAVDEIAPTHVVVSSGGGGSSSGGGGSGGGGGGGGSMDPYPEEDASSPEPATASGGSTMKTALVVGGLLLGAYLLFGQEDE